MLKYDILELVQFIFAFTGSVATISYAISKFRKSHQETFDWILLITTLVVLSIVLIWFLGKH